MSARTQAKVLRVLQNGEVEPVGSQTPCAGRRAGRGRHQPGPARTRSRPGSFREDLFYRLNVVPIRTPPLREHLEDVPELVDYFVRRFAAATNYRRREFSAEALEHLKTLPWRGNVRELQEPGRAAAHPEPRRDDRARTTCVRPPAARPAT